ncbi:hypothetical protein [Methylomicrobium agile]|uniref:hypothetical protein n=1 Tax=Methylomicrobium agile TaxID=39774 RepID=UPI001470303F|nr:hypothetical protein [Methylomicrobium agile]
MLTAVPGHAVRAQEVAFDLNPLPREGRTLDDFTPRGWTVADKTDGDLNADGIADIAAILVPSSTDSTAEEGPRVLLALLGGAGGKFRPAGHNGGFLVCMHCGGVKESSGVEIKRGVLIVHQLTGSREFTDQTWRFRYDPKLSRFVLIGKDRTDGDGLLGTGDKVSFNYLTGFRISERYRYDPKRNREITLASKKEKIPKTTPFLEDVGME